MNKKKVEKANISYLEVEELACKILGLDYDEIDPDTIEEELCEQFQIDLDIFRIIVSRLVPLIDVGRGVFALYKGFSDPETKTWLLKMEIKEKES